MRVGNWYNVEFLVAPSQSGLREEAQGKSTGASKQIFLTDKMRVTLLADKAVKAIAKTPALQSLGRDRSATWQWNISPRSGGDLELTAQVEILDPDGEVADTYTKYVTVHASVGGMESFMSGTKAASTAGNALTEMFKSWREALLALAALITAAFVVVRVVRNRGNEPQGESAGPSST